MGDSIGDSIETPYITNLLGKDPKQMSDDKNVLLAQHVCCFVLPFFVDEASERKVSTFLIIFRKQFPTLVC